MRTSMIRDVRRMAVAVTGLLAFAMSSPAGAIVYGEPDGTRHPNVGSLVLLVPVDGVEVPVQICSGTLVAPRIFLTAAHCVAGFEWVPFEVTFDPVIVPPSAGGTYHRGRAVAHPAYTDYQGAGGFSRPHDLAVFLLDAAPAGITPAPVARPGHLDRFGQSLRSREFAAVGYGSRRDTRTGGPNAILPNLERRTGNSSFRSLHGAWLFLSMNQATGDAGTCYGDSGGPHFLDGVVVSITATGDRPCKSLDATYRVDTPEAWQFLGPYLAG